MTSRKKTNWSPQHDASFLFPNFITRLPNNVDNPTEFTKHVDLGGVRWTLRITVRANTNTSQGMITHSFDAKMKCHAKSKYFQKANLVLRVGHTGCLVSRTWRKSFEHSTNNGFYFKQNKDAVLLVHFAARHPNQALAVHLAAKYCFDKPIVHEKTDALGSSMLSMFQKEQKCDVWFELKDGVTVGAHSMVLFARSDFLSGLIDGEDSSTTIQLATVNSTPFIKFLEYLYNCVEVKGTKEELIELLLTANFLEGLGFKRHLESTLVSMHLTTETCIELFIVADTYSAPYLREESFQMLLSNTKTLRTHPSWQALVENRQLYDEIINAALDDKQTDDSMYMCNVYKILTESGELATVDGPKPALVEHVKKKRRTQERVEVVEIVGND